MTEPTEPQDHVLKPGAVDINSLKVTPIDLSPIYNKPKRTIKKTVKKFLKGSEEQNGPLAFVVDNVCTLEECNALIQLSENDPNSAYEDALVNVGGKQALNQGVRNNLRYIRDDFVISSEIFNRISHLLPQTWNEESFPLSCLNERLRFLKYKPGQRFKVHHDVHYRRNDHSETSFVTLQLYLNEGFKGGETTFVEKGYEDDVRIPVVPKTGRVLIFEHRLCHEGSELTEGVKYVIRTDVMYKTDF